MSIRRYASAGRVQAAAILLALAGLAGPFSASVSAQGVVTTRAVGGVSINADGVLDNAQADALGELARLRKEALQAVAGEMNKRTDLRKVSLRRIQAAIESQAKDGKALPDDIAYLAGLQQIRYVFVDPEHKDIVLAGPAEGWTVDARGYVVGRTTKQPVMLLDDLLVALRTAKEAADRNISCSINPTDDGLKRLRAHVAKLRTIGDPQTTAAGIENALGPQIVSVDGVPGTSHFARVLVAADYRMKRIAMAFEPSPVRGLPSFLQMAGAGPRGMSNMLPRWWLEPRYEAILRDDAGLAWELRGASVKAMTEDDFQNAQGAVERTGEANPVAQRWADAMTAHFSELATADPIFGQLQDCMDLAVAATLIVRENLCDKAGCDLGTLLDAAAVPVEQFPAPKSVASKASLVHKGRNWIIAASGGVMISPTALVKDVRVDESLKGPRSNAIGQREPWWWD